MTSYNYYLCMGFEAGLGNVRIYLDSFCVLSN
jgi:hypothetical protein